ncbi:ERI1 exoribonuclease 3 [Nematostella vectensis]|uniref:ERI1 exoribonuclease 3 n=1 Tax=Nematostella vectensis TaxID=45351 RepID=UPI0013905D37|nr:ERI1 exoribonuclease 3 [Nematostella vectensis]
MDNSSCSSSPVFDYYLVLDFEATCDDKNKPKPQEIIEFPVTKVNSRTLQTEAEFHQYVCPTAHPKLTTFCTDLTGITQDMVEGKPDLQTTLQTFHDWMGENGLLDSGLSSCFVTCGDWDLKTMLPLQCKHLNIPVPTYFRKWINIKKVYSDVMGKQSKIGMPGMLHGLGLELVGRHHSGIDDARNITKILVALARKHPNISATGKM